MFRGKVLKPLTPGVATIVTYNDDSVDILEWNDGIPTSMIRDARQLRHLIVKEGKVVDSVIKAGKKGGFRNRPRFSSFGKRATCRRAVLVGGYGPEPATNYGADWFIATRSAFGVRADGNLVFAIGHHISTKDLAKALVLAGCERGIHADSNPHNVVGNLYYTNPDGTIVKRTKLSPDQKNYTLDRYDRSYTSDFFGIFLKLGNGGIMMRMIGVLIGIVLMISGTLQPAAAQELCETHRVQWLATFDALKKGMEDYRLIKTASITPRITEVFSNGNRASMATVWCRHLKERADRMAEAGDLCQDLAASERQAYDMWRKCGAAGQQRRSAPSQVSPGNCLKGTRQTARRIA